MTARAAAACLLVDVASRVVNKRARYVVKNLFKSFARGVSPSSRCLYDLVEMSCFGSCSILREQHAERARCVVFHLNSSRALS